MDILINININISNEYIDKYLCLHQFNFVKICCWVYMKAIIKVKVFYLYFGFNY